MLIGQLVKETQLSKDTIRFYEKHGLISVNRNERRINNYKEYSKEVLSKLLTIKRLKSFGFTLNEIADLLKMIKEQQASCKNVSDKINTKIELIDKKIYELIAIKTLLQNGIKKCLTTATRKHSDANCQILIADKSHCV